MIVLQLQTTKQTKIERSTKCPRCEGEETGTFHKELLTFICEEFFFTHHF